MSRKDLQNISLGTDAQKAKSAVAAVGSPAVANPVETYVTGEGISLRSYYRQDDIDDAEHLNFAAGIAPYLRGPYSTMYVRQPWTIRQYACF